MSNVIGLDSASQAAADLDGYIERGLQYVELYVKWATPALVKLIHSKGLGIALINESTADRAKAGYAAGVADSKALLAAIPRKLGVASLPSMVAPAWTDDEDTQAVDPAEGAQLCGGP